MNTNQAGIDLIKEFEGVQLKAYRCPANVLTIGYGHTGADVKAGMTISAERAEELLRQDLASLEETLSKCLGGVDTSPNQFSAMVALAYNIGAGAFKSSSVLRFHRGKSLSGLTRRRQAESALYLRG